MKKIISFALATCMASSVFALTACGNGGVDGAVKGNYTEMNATNQEQAMAEIAAFESNVNNAGGLVGDTTQADWKFGVSALADLEIKYDMGTDEMPDEADIDLSANFALQFSQTADAIDMKGAGKFSLGMKGKSTAYGLTTEIVKTDYQMKGHAYIEDLYTYIGVTSSGKMDGEAIPKEESELYGKISVGTLMESLGSMMPELPQPDVGNVDTAGIVSMVQTLQEAGLNVAYELNSTSGLKLKASVTRDMLMELFSSMMEGAGGTAYMTMQTLPVTFDEAKVDFYMVIGTTGLLEQISFDLDVDINIMDEMSIEVDGGVVIKMGSDIVVNNIPQGLKDDVKYQEMA